MGWGGGRRKRRRVKGNFLAVSPLVHADSDRDSELILCLPWPYPMVFQESKARAGKVAL